MYQNKAKLGMELLAPAGSPEALDAAIGEGADAVYLGLKDFNARLRSTNFTYSQFEGALRILRKMGKKIYVTVNTVFEQREADRMYQFLKYLEEQGPDALIVQDFGVVEMAKTHFPSLRLHASTQMNIASARGANALSRFGVSRVVLSRELSLEDLRNIKSKTNMELEIFVHGALCISVSGLCLFSSFLGGKSANRGMCTQACRRLFKKTGAVRNEGESGYYFSPNDLQLLEHIPDLSAAGITALKIEGRMKSASYVGAVVSAYRLVVDAVAGGDEGEIKNAIERGQEILRNDFARAKTKYFFTANSLADNTENSEKKNDWLNPDQDGGTGISLGTILKVKGGGDERRALIYPPRGMSLSARDSVRIHRGDDSGRVSHKLAFAEADGKGFWISAPEGSIGDSVYLIQIKEKNKHYKHIISGNIASKGPGRDKAPRHLPGNKPGKNFPDGLYVAVSRPEDLFIVQSSRPQRVILVLSKKNAGYLFANKQPLPFKKTEIIFSLDPWFPPENQILMEDIIESLIEEGYTQFIVNNLGHFSLFKNYKSVNLMAGPWLYTFNSWSLSFIASLGVDGIITPLENNRQNLERTLSIKGSDKRRSSPLLSSIFITVFSYPPLFNIKANLANLNLKSFADNMGETFLLNTCQEGSKVYPNKYFSIIDKIPFLKQSGFGKFIIDLTGTTIKKSNYKDLIQAVKENTPLPNSERFNWKDGFYQSDKI
ncbi:MAG: U32 family peptidase [Treponema sp.]|nr:U32 family peptidase [Treponema sp.]